MRAVGPRFQGLLRIAAERLIERRLGRSVAHHPALRGRLRAEQVAHHPRNLLLALRLGMGIRLRQLARIALITVLTARAEHVNQCPAVNPLNHRHGYFPYPLV